MKITINGIQQEGYILSPMTYVPTIRFYKDENYIEVVKDEYDMKMKHNLINGEYDIMIKYPTDWDEFETAVACRRDLPEDKRICLKGCVLQMEKAIIINDYIVRIPFSCKKIERFF